jgi:hypothetical protein
MKVNEIIVEGATWDAVKSGISKVGTGIGKVAGSVAGAGRAAVSAYNQGASAIATGYDAAAAKVGGSPSFKKTAGTAATLQRYRSDWEQFSQGYQQGGADLSDMAVLAPILNQYIKRRYGVDASKYTGINLASTRSKDVANYIYSLNIRAQADDQLNPANSNTQLQTGYAAPTADTKFTDPKGNTYTYTAPTGGAADGVWRNYKGTAITEPKDIQTLNQLYLLSQRGNARQSVAPAARRNRPRTRPTTP